MHDGEIIRQLRRQSRILGRVVQALQKVQDGIPRPSEREIAELRRGGSLSVAAYLIGLLQRVLVNVENAASDLRTGADEKMLSRVDKLRPCAIEINAISAALDEPMDVERGG